MIPPGHRYNILRLLNLFFRSCILSALVNLNFGRTLKMMKSCVTLMNIFIVETLLNLPPTPGPGLHFIVTKGMQLVEFASSLVGLEEAAYARPGIF